MTWQVRIDWRKTHLLHLLLTQFILFQELMYTGLYQDFNVYMCVCVCARMRERPDPAFSIVRYYNFHIDLSEIHPCSSEGLQTNLATQNQDQYSEHQKPDRKSVV